MPYPLSSNVSSGQPTEAAQYNNLRADALLLGQVEADSVKLNAFLSRYARGIKLQYLATNRLRIPFITTDPPTLMINGCMCQATANVDLASGLISGSAATWYVFAQRTSGQTTFTITINTSATEGTDQRIIGDFDWDGTNIISIRDYFRSPLADPDYDSGWFAVSTSILYTKAHGMPQQPHLVLIYHSASAAGADEWVWVGSVVSATTEYSPYGVDRTNIYIQTGSNTSSGVLCSARRCATSGYYRVFAWK